MTVSFARVGKTSALASLVLALFACGDREEKAARPTPTPVQTVAPAPTQPVAANPAPVVVAVATAVPTATPQPKAARPVKAKPKGDGKELAVKKLVLATDVEKGARTPVGVSSSFKKGEFERIFAFLEVANPGDESEVVVSFDPPSDDPAKGLVRLAVGSSPRWRTWATSRGIDEPGTWTAIVSAPDGRELARETFEVL